MSYPSHAPWLVIVENADPRAVVGDRSHAEVYRFSTEEAAMSSYREWEAVISDNATRAWSPNMVVTFVRALDELKVTK